MYYFHFQDFRKRPHRYFTCFSLRFDQFGLSLGPCRRHFGSEMWSQPKKKNGKQRWRNIGRHSRGQERPPRRRKKCDSKGCSFVEFKVKTGSQRRRIPTGTNVPNRSGSTRTRGLGDVNRSVDCADQQNRIGSCRLVLLSTCTTSTPILSTSRPKIEQLARMTSHGFFLVSVRRDARPMRSIPLVFRRKKKEDWQIVCQTLQ